jgi:group I intron endonuclease
MEKQHKKNLNSKIIGIYKITCMITGRIYIGQSWNITQRFYRYKSFGCKGQVKLYNSLVKYGIKNHIFEVVECCEIKALNKRERYWQDFYDATSRNGLNLRLTESDEKPRTCSDETKRKISLKNKGRIVSEETRKKLSLAGKGRVFSVESRKKMSDWQIGRKMSPEAIEKSRKANTGKVISIEWRKNISNGSAMAKIVLDTQTGIYYNSAKQASIAKGINHSSLTARLNGERKNKTGLIYA